MGEKRTFLVEDLRVKPTLPIDKYNSRFAYILYFRGKVLDGLWKLDSVDISNRTHTYERLKPDPRVLKLRPVKSKRKYRGE